jgi:probable rRNA maturation factor
VPPGELSVVILDARAMGELHAEFLDDPSPTDVITFEGDPAAGLAGEICVCADVARDYARTHQTDFAAELALYIAHGYLHLAGFDDTTVPARRRMRRAEKIAMRILVSEHAMPHARWKHASVSSRRVGR